MIQTKTQNLRQFRHDMLRPAGRARIDTVVASCFITHLA